MDENNCKLSPAKTLLCLGILLVISIVFFHSAFGGILLSTDDNIGDLALRKSGIPYSFFGRWVESPLAGFSALFSISWTNLWLWALPINIFSNWIHAIDLFVASLFFVLFLRERKCGMYSVLLGSLTAFWLGSNFTLTYAGHIGKFGILALASAAFFFIEKYSTTRRISWGILAGGAMGAMFLEQVDVALIFCIPLGCYTLFALWQNGHSALSTALRLIPMMLVVVVLAANTLSVIFETFLNPTNTIAVEQETPEQKWIFSTQWSFPPDETIGLVAPGYTGWRSGDQEGPYWGRVGRSENWSVTTPNHGMQNLMLENTYIGAIPILLALLGASLVFPGIRSNPFILFWIGVAILALLLSYGKYFPLYALFYKLPVVHNIRNPNKYIQVFQLALGVLSALGLEFLVNKNQANQKEMIP